MKPLMRRPDDARPWGLIVVLMLAATTGLVSIPLQVSVLKQGDSASAADADRIAALTQQLAMQQEMDTADAKLFREDTRKLILAICDQIEAVSEQARLEVPPCPRVATIPAVTPSASPR